MLNFIAEHPVSMTFAAIAVLLLLGAMRNRLVDAFGATASLFAAPFVIGAVQLNRILGQISDWTDRGLATLKSANTADQQKPWVSLTRKQRARLLPVCLGGLGLTFASVAALFMWGAAVQTGEGSGGEIQESLEWLFWLLLAIPLLAATGLSLWAALASPTALIVVVLMVVRALISSIEAACRVIVWTLDKLLAMVVSLIDLVASPGSWVLNVGGRLLPDEWTFEIEFKDRVGVEIEETEPISVREGATGTRGESEGSAFEAVIYPCLWLALGLTLAGADIYTANLRLAALLGVRPYLAFIDLPVDLFLSVMLVCIAAAFGFAIAELVKPPVLPEPDEPLMPIDPVGPPPASAWPVEENWLGELEPRTEVVSPGSKSGVVPASGLDGASARRYRRLDPK